MTNGAGGPQTGFSDESGSTPNLLGPAHSAYASLLELLLALDPEPGYVARAHAHAQADAADVAERMRLKAKHISSQDREDVIMTTCEAAIRDVRGALAKVSLLQALLVAD